MQPDLTLYSLVSLDRVNNTSSFNKAKIQKFVSNSKDQISEFVGLCYTGITTLNPDIRLAEWEALSTDSVENATPPISLTFRPTK